MQTTLLLLTLRNERRQLQRRHILRSVTRMQLFDNQESGTHTGNHPVILSLRSFMPGSELPTVMATGCPRNTTFVLSTNFL